jgi:hypothetical protein
LVFGAIALVIAAWALVGLASRRELLAAWHEPVLRYPVLIIESDDWGPGPPADADRLSELISLLERHRDETGRPAVMTLGLLLSAVDGSSSSWKGKDPIPMRRLDDPAFRPIVSTVRTGRERGVFALQLHGMAHYWPPALLAAAATDARVRRWLSAEGTTRHESLPSALQCRWVDGSRLPSRPLPTADIDTAVAEEVNAFRTIFGGSARVVVPPSFVWDARVEAAWARNGIEAVVTPGHRFVGIAEDGSLTADFHRIWNGERAGPGPTYVVRNDYFEPIKGHRAERALAALAEKTAAARPTLLETHRCNFTAPDDSATTALRELGTLLDEALRMFPTLRFLSTLELATALRRRDPALTDRGFGVRIHAWLRRLAAVPRVRKLAWLTGLVAPGALALALTRGTRPSPTHVDR